MNKKEKGILFWFIAMSVFCLFVGGMSGYYLKQMEDFEKSEFDSWNCTMSIKMNDEVVISDSNVLIDNVSISFPCNETNYKNLIRKRGA